MNKSPDFTREHNATCWHKQLGPGPYTSNLDEGPTQATWNRTCTQATWNRTCTQATWTRALHEQPILLAFRPRNKAPRALVSVIRILMMDISLMHAPGYKLKYCNPLQPFLLQIDGNLQLPFTSIAVLQSLKMLMCITCNRLQLSHIHTRWSQTKVVIFIMVFMHT